MVSGMAGASLSSAADPGRAERASADAAERVGRLAEGPWVCPERFCRRRCAAVRWRGRSGGGIWDRRRGRSVENARPHRRARGQERLVGRSERQARGEARRPGHVDALRYDPAHRPGRWAVRSTVRRMRRTMRTPRDGRPGERPAVVPVGRGAGEERGGEPAATGRRDRPGAAPLCGDRRTGRAGWPGSRS